MSAKNRGAVTDALEWYPTPGYCVRRLLDVLDLEDKRLWCEPMAGDAAIIRAVDEYYGLPTNRDWTALDIDPRFANVLDMHADDVEIGDAFANPMTGSIDMFDVLITNPSFSLAQRLVAHVRNAADYLIILQRLNWMASGKRRSFFACDMPDVYVLPNRPMFRLNEHGKLGSDACDYAWYVWTPTPHTYGRVSVLPTTSKAELAQAKEEQLAALAKWKRAA